MRAITDEEVRAELRSAVAEASSLRQWARQHKLSPSYVSDVLSEARRPGEKILAALGLRRQIVYEGTDQDGERA
ncbi:MAG TPA: hypothetical protein PKD53_27245 [Chloroflexaceae bacterium]|nr:hypothetical protein [Chloroflexaceae bacterium]